jgi:hypothetical protein
MSLNPRKRRDMAFWRRFGEKIVDKVLDALDYWCWHVSGDTVENCYSAHAGLSLYELAEEFAGWSYSGITDKDLETLKKMPDSIYNELNEKVRKRIEDIVRELREEWEREIRGELELEG